MITRSVVRLRILAGGIAGLALLVGSASRAEQAQQSGSACRLLDVTELETALKGKASTKPSGSRQSVPQAMTLCILTGRPSVASHTTCSIPRGSGYVELDVIGNVASLPSIQTVGALLAKAATRR